MQFQAPISRRELVWIAAAIAVGLALRLHFYTGLIASDDLTHAHAAANFLPEDNRGNLAGANGRRIGVNLPLYLSITTFGAHEWSLALVPLLFSLLGIWIAAMTVRRLALHVAMARLAQEGGETDGARAPPWLASTAVIASVGGAWLWATLPIDIYTATVWMQDNIFATALMATLYCLLRVSDRPRLFAVLAGFGLGYLQFCKENAAFLTFVVGAWLIFQIVRQRSERRAWALHMAWMAGAYVLVHLVAIAYFWRITGQPLHYYTTTIARYLVLAKDLPLRFPFPSNWTRFYYYLRADWIFGYGFYLFPLWTAALLTTRGLRDRLLLTGAFAIQLFILTQALKLGTWTQRYTLQVSAVYILVTGAGLVCAANWLPRRWREGAAARRQQWVIASGFALLVALQIASLCTAHQQHGRSRGQTVRDGFAYLQRVAGERDKIYVDVASNSPTFTKRSFEVLNGFRKFKGGILPMSAAAGATDGWAVLSHLEHNYRVRAKLTDRPIPDNWLEVFRSENNGRRYWMRVFRILPAATRLRVVKTPVRGAIVEVWDADFRPVGASRLALSKRWRSGLTSIVADDTQPGRFTLAAEDSPGHHYGGLEFAVDGLNAIRFQLALRSAADVEAIFVYAQDSAGERTTRWRWSLAADQRTGELTAPIALVPGEPSAGFTVIDADVPSEQIATVTVLVRARPGASVTAEVTALETAEPRAQARPPSASGDGAPDDDAPNDAAPGDAGSPTPSIPGAAEDDR